MAYNNICTQLGIRGTLTSHLGCVYSDQVDRCYVYVRQLSPSDPKHAEKSIHSSARTRLLTKRHSFPLMGFSLTRANISLTKVQKQLLPPLLRCYGEIDFKRWPAHSQPITLTLYIDARSHPFPGLGTSRGTLFLSFPGPFLTLIQHKAQHVESELRELQTH